MAVRLIALDIDGTLLNSSFEVSARNRAAIADATGRGIEVALVTGRRYDFALPVAQLIDSPLTMIVNNGAMVRSKNGVTYLRHLLDKETARLVLQCTEPWREGAAVVFDRPRANQVILERIDLNDPLRGGYYSRNRRFLAECNPLQNCLDEDPLQVMFTGGVTAMRAVESTLLDAHFRAQIAMAITVYEDKDFAMLDVINPRISKGTTLAEWAAMQGIEREEILAIGDNHNDEAMLSFAGIPVVMANSVPELKTHGWHETHSNDDDGVAAAIERFALREATECA